jgi:predicted RNA-binding protein with RPS1 domain
VANEVEMSKRRSTNCYEDDDYRRRPLAFQSISSVLFHRTPQVFISKGIVDTVARIPSCPLCTSGKYSLRYRHQFIATPLWSTRFKTGKRDERYRKHQVTSGALEDKTEEGGIDNSMDTVNSEQSKILTEEDGSTESPSQSIAGIEETAETKDASTKKQVSGKGRKGESGSRFRVLFDEIEVGQEYVGKVRKVTNYGAFIDIGCFTDGLLHVSQMSDTYVKDPAEIVKVGDEIKVRVVNKKPEKKEFSLSIRPPKAVKKREEPQDIAPTKAEENNDKTDSNNDSESFKVRGKSSISRLQRIGFSANLESSTDDSNKATSRVGSNARRPPRESSGKGSPSMRASLKKLARETDEQKFVQGTVVSITEFGVFVDFGGPSDGLIHISEVTEDKLEKDESGNRKINLSVGDKVQVRVIHVDVNRSRVSLSMKPFALSAKKQLQEDLAAANESQPEFESVLALALRKALQEKEAELATKSRH